MMLMDLLIKFLLEISLLAKVTVLVINNGKYTSVQFHFHIFAFEKVSSSVVT